MKWTRQSEARVFRTAAFIVAAFLAIYVAVTKPTALSPYFLGLDALWLTAAFGFTRKATNGEGKARKMAREALDRVVDSVSSAVAEDQDVVDQPVDNDEGEGSSRSGSSRRSLHGRLLEGLRVQRRSTPGRGARGAAAHG